MLTSSLLCDFDRVHSNRKQGLNLGVDFKVDDLISFINNPVESTNVRNALVTSF